MLVIKQIKLICTICNTLYSRDVAFVSLLQLRLNVLCSETDLIQILSDSPESRKKTPNIFVECASWCLIHEPMRGRLSNQKHTEISIICHWETAPPLLSQALVVMALGLCRSGAHFSCLGADLSLALMRHFWPDPGLGWTLWLLLWDLREKEDLVPALLA